MVVFCWKPSSVCEIEGQWGEVNIYRVFREGSVTKWHSSRDVKGRQQSTELCAGELSRQRKQQLQMVLNGNMLSTFKRQQGSWSEIARRYTYEATKLQEGRSYRTLEAIWDEWEVLRLWALGMTGAPLWSADCEIKSGCGEAH